ncbi:Allergen Asp f 4 [Madurella mycetomatis]|uniref:Allergen Asp f 4 n=1 Tax=Madurella mycetomatis TaxID=100816 RepID=A0A175W8P1_9PEZI|nr:Allergen Asp f 4 [Madurella mycetomatis]
MQLAHFLLLAGALGAAAHPSSHAHLHRAHAKREGPVFVKNVHNRPAPKPTPKVDPTPAINVASVSQPDDDNDKHHGIDDDRVSDDYIPFCGGGVASKSKRVTHAQVMYKGNTGEHDGCPWNSNLMLVPNKLASKYDYVQRYTNVASEPYQVVCGNKIGVDGQLTGMFEIKDKNQNQNHLIFMLQPGETKIVVADVDTQGICAFAPYKVPLTEHGQFAGVWAEFDFASETNEGWSGADCSSLVAQFYNMDVPGCRMAEGGVESIILAGGIGRNAYTKGMEELDGIGLNIVPGRNVIQVDVGYFE